MDENIGEREEDADVRGKKRQKSFGVVKVIEAELLKF